ncbi:MAG: DUF3164 family protein [Pseudohongiellaceae bacterium]|nr:DUF3164 family protein [Pseudohongiellaceae bacterium]
MNTVVPEGFKLDTKGRLAPIESIKPIDLARDELVMDIVAKAQEISDQLAATKKSIHDDIDAFVEMSAEQYDVKLGGSKGNVSLLSFDGRYKVLLARHDHIVFDERLQAAKKLIDECLQEWSKGAHKGLIVMIDDAFRTDRNGELRTARILALRRHDIDDERWSKAMDAISDALQVVGSKSYIRVYERIADTDNYRQIPLDIASVPTLAEV